MKQMLRDLKIKLPFLLSGFGPDYPDGLSEPYDYSRLLTRTSVSGISLNSFNSTFVSVEP